MIDFLMYLHEVMKDSFLINVDFFRIGRVYNIVFFRFDKTTKNRNLLFIVNFTITIKFCTLSCRACSFIFIVNICKAFSNEWI